MNQQVLRAVAAVVNPASGDARRATKYLSPALTIKATRRHRPRRGQDIGIVLTIGKPNYAERAFIKQAKQAGEPFPIRRVQLKPWPSK